MTTDPAAADEARVEAIARAIAISRDCDPDKPLSSYGKLTGHLLWSNFAHYAHDIIAADPATQTILDLEAKVAALTKVAEDAKALAKAAIEREAKLREALEAALPHLDYKRRYVQTTAAMKAVAKDIKNCRAALTLSRQA